LIQEQGANAYYTSFANDSADLRDTAMADRDSSDEIINDIFAGVFADEDV
jgi:hypothetical protein